MPPCRAATTTPIGSLPTASGAAISECRRSSRSPAGKSLSGSEVRIVDEEEGRQLNQGFRRRDHATNVLTFDYARAPVVVADLVLCAPVVAREAKEQGKTLADHYAHLLVHGTLHAQGWDHEISLKDAHAMEAKEIEILALLGVRNPYQ